MIDLNQKKHVMSVNVLFITGELCISLTFIQRTHRVLLKRHLTNAPRNLNALYTHPES